MREMFENTPLRVLTDARTCVGHFEPQGDLARRLVHCSRGDRHRQAAQLVKASLVNIFEERELEPQSNLQAMQIAGANRPTASAAGAW